MKIAILGSSGQIGAHLTKYLRNKGHEILEADIVNGPDQDITSDSISSHTEEVICESDFVFFLAFDVGGSRYLKKYQHTYDFIHNNSKIMVKVFRLLKMYNKPFVFASSQMSNMNYSPYGVLKSVGELYTKSLNGLIVKFWNVYGIEHDKEKSHVITDFIRKGFETGKIDMLTDGQEVRDFLYAEDCCEGLEMIMNNYRYFNSETNLHLTSFANTKIIDIAHIIVGQFNLIGKYDVEIIPSDQKDTVQLDKQNAPDTSILRYWIPQTPIEQGIANIFNEMKNNYVGI